jgi:hypothetical protein
MDWLTPAATAILGFITGILVGETWHRNTETTVGKVASKAVEHAIAHLTDRTLSSDKFTIVEPPPEETIGEHIFNSTPVDPNYVSPTGSALPVGEVTHVSSSPQQPT